MGQTMLSLDYSTTCTGYAVWDVAVERPLAQGTIKPKKRKGIPDGSLAATMTRLEDAAAQVCTLVEAHQPQWIVIEEVNRGIGRLSQKTLCMGHAVLLQALREVLDRVMFVDSDGRDGWRTQLGLRLTTQDKLTNAQVRRYNKTAPKGSRKKEITKKTLACRFVNEVLGTQLDEHANPADADLADAIGLGWAWLKRRTQKA